MQMGGFTFDQDVFREKLTNAIILHEYPLSIVEQVGFKEIFHYIRWSSAIPLEMI